MFSKQFKLQNINYEIYDSKIGSLPPSGSWPQPGWFGKNARIAFIGQNPGLPRPDEPFEHERRQECYLKYVIESPTGSIIQNILKQSSLTWDDVVYTNLVKSPTPGNRVPLDYEIEFYKKILKSQLECTNLNVFIIFGKSAVSTLLGEIPIPMCVNDVSVDWSPQPVTAFAVYHPAYIQRIGKVVEYTESISDFIKEQNVTFLLRDQPSGHLQDSSPRLDDEWSENLSSGDGN